MAFLAVTVFGALPGIAVAVGLSLLNFIRHAWRPHDAVLGRVTGYKGYHDLGRHPEARLVPGLVLYRWDAPLFFANADLFREHVLEIVDHAPPPVRWLAVTSEPMTDIDTTAADMLDELITELARRGVELHFADMKGHVKDRLRTYGLFDRLGGDHFHPTVGHRGQGVPGAPPGRGVAGLGGRAGAAAGTSPRPRSGPSPGATDAAARSPPAASRGRAAQATRLRRASHAATLPVGSRVSSVSATISSTRQPAAAGSAPQLAARDPARAEPERVPVAPAQDEARPPGRTAAARLAA